MKLFRKLAVIIISAAFITSCGSVALTGRKQLLIYPDSEILSLSEQSYSQFMNTSKPSADVLKTKMVKDVCYRMSHAMEEYFKKTGQSSYMQGLSWKCDLIQSKEVNAFCLPSGKIVIYEGILSYANTPDLMAVVMGHEMAHAIARHSNERMSQQSLVSTVTSALEQAVAGKVTNEKLAVFDVALGMGSKFGVLLPFSRKQEYEADNIGLIIMAIAGYDIDKAPVLWETMSAGKGSSVPEFMSTHPSDANRILQIRKNIPQARKYAGK